MAAFGNQYAIGNNGGRPLKYKSPEEMQEKIDAYFKSCYINIDGFERNIRPLTISGLAYHLETTREILMDYQNRPEFSNTVKRAKHRIENYAEEQLFVGKNTAGVIFNMINNYPNNWKNIQEVKNTNTFKIVGESSPEEKANNLNQLSEAVKEIELLEE